MRPLLLGAPLKSPWATDDATVTATDWQRPLGKLTPVATSATLGDDGDPSAIMEFATTVTGEDIPASAVITETRLTREQWIGDATARVAARRSEERRVGKECRSRWSPAHSRTKRAA